MEEKRTQESSSGDRILLTCTSIFGGSVILTQRTMNHIKERHPEVFSLENLVGRIQATVEEPEFVAKGRTNEYVSLRRISDTHRFLAVFYIDNGRIKTVFITSKPESFRRRGVIWPK